MPKRPFAAINRLPDQVRAELESRIVASAFGDYRQHAEWLEQQGHIIGKSTLHKYGQQLQAKRGVRRIALKASEQVEAVKWALLAGEFVDQVTAINRGWGLRLASIIYRLKGRGWPIRVERDNGNGLARYWLPPGWSPPTSADTKKPR